MSEPSASLDWLAARGSEVTLRCCTFQGLSPAVLARMYGGQTTLVELKNLIRCPNCRKTPAERGTFAELGADPMRAFYRSDDAKFGRKGYGDS